MTEFTITLPMPPSVNQLYTGMGKNRRKHPNYSAWCNEAGWRMNEQKSAGAFGSLLPDVWYWTDVSLPENHLGDSDNRLKALHDLLHEMGATPDDKWLLGGTFMRCPDVVSGTCVVHAVSVPGGAKAQMDQLRFLAERFGRVSAGHLSAEA
ncbi:hypothetical protein GTA62_14625 [Roseobacter sp. HKCCD9010]|uniref:hypothetical protein n=1 Tax=unclassified Roseobacter TaxID=196798 RepID=UPI001492D7CC|nr:MULTISPECIES: hypothetical protein [unclassified Roseobacter]MBF9050655.1 hypothetical protein [Rhodobacterales bacterium HKCCD4356]NNV11927.1 hypothetical protein [Roseobacter sp. HKCCD7357]NNV16940.1 hypothetical protein [Roseobacter sp. HKCCD8768]NNV26169.1 hypothetical protein [Roseobacter sp. HKCCD8192]NNV30662.1 hypothetical protein [Roseobacter sp. HKCCD9061]